MANKIREDLVGVVYVDGHVLQAGDEVPEGVEVGDHLFDDPKADAAKKPAAKSDK